METASFHHTAPILRIVKQVPKPCNSRLPIGFKGLQSHGLSLTSNIEPNLHRFGGDVVAAKCAAWDSGFLGKLEEGEEEEWMKVGRLMREKCKERKGMVELLECLEKEAIQGEDQGREASDYNRRAQIFDKSSRVFQALKASTELNQS